MLPKRSTKRKRSDTPVAAGSGSSSAGQCLSFSDERFAAEALQGALLSMFRDGRFADICLTVQGSDFRCHRAVLAAGSDFFETLFESGMRDAQAHELQLPEVLPWPLLLPPVPEIGYLGCGLL